MHLNVLVLVLMEYALRLMQKVQNVFSLYKSLNPCFNGICSKTNLCYKQKKATIEVLILVLMEYALRPRV